MADDIVLCCDCGCFVFADPMIGFWCGCWDDSPDLTSTEALQAEDCKSTFTFIPF